MTAALPMGSQKITGMADPTVATDGATKNYVDTTTGTFFSTGDAKLTFKIVPDSGWLMLDDGTFGSASSGSSNSNNIANLALFTLFFNAPFTDANVPILTSGGGATTRAAQVSASAAWAANCRMSLPKTLGRAMGIAGSGSGLTARVLGQTFGEENHALTSGENGPHDHGGITGNDTPAHVHQTGSIAITPGGAGPALAQGGSGVNTSGPIAPHQHSITSSGSGTAHNTMQPTTFINCMVKI